VGRCVAGSEACKGVACRHAGEQEDERWAHVQLEALRGAREKTLYYQENGALWYRMVRVRMRGVSRDDVRTEWYVEGGGRLNPVLPMWLERVRALTPLRASLGAASRAHSQHDSQQTAQSSAHACYTSIHILSQQAAHLRRT
jgi:hypothetical protein